MGIDDSIFELPSVVCSTSAVLYWPFGLNALPAALSLQIASS